MGVALTNQHRPWQCVPLYAASYVRGIIMHRRSNGMHLLLLLLLLPFRHDFECCAVVCVCACIRIHSPKGMHCVLYYDSSILIPTKGKKKPSRSDLTTWEAVEPKAAASFIGFPKLSNEKKNVMAPNILGKRPKCGQRLRNGLVKVVRSKFNQIARQREGIKKKKRAR